MKLEVGMYVRTKNRGIAKFRGWNTYDENKVAIHTHNEGDVAITPMIDKNTIVKASHNIIDLIEVKNIIEIDVTDEDNYSHILGINFIRIENERDLSNIKDMISNESAKLMRILTHQQFEQMAYKVGDK